jgi:L-arabinonolactonase
MTLQIRRVGDSKDLLGESPCWDSRAGLVCWVDSLGGMLRRNSPFIAQAPETHPLPAPVGSIALCESGAFVGALKDRFVRYDPVTRQLDSLGRIDVLHPDVRLNDGKCDPWGSFIAGTLQVHRAPDAPVLGGLYRLRPDRRVEVLARDFALTNGPCFSPDGRTLYVADSAIGTRTIWAYDYAPDGPLANRRVFARTDSYGAGPDGAAIDVEGCLWTALPRIGQLARFTPHGELERMVKMPATHPTSLCFGGAGLELAYVTSISRSANLTGPLPHDGGLFEVSGLPAAGLPAHRYRDD